MLRRSESPIHRQSALWAVLAGVLIVATGTVVRGQERSPAAAESLDAARSTVPTDPGSDVAIPPYFFGPLKLSGKVLEDGNSAELTANLEVHVTRDEGWYDVPLRLNQGYVIDMRYEGPREPIPRLSPDLRDEGQRWLFSGRGTHRLTLQLRVPIRKGAAGSSLQLLLPSVARQFPTQLSLDVAGQSLTFTGGAENTVRRIIPGAAGSNVQVEIEGGRLDISWRESPDRPAVISRVFTSVTLDRIGDTLRLHAQQDLVVDGKVSSVLVRLPTGFRLSGPTAVSGPGYLSHEIPQDESGWVRVHVIEPERGGISLEWELEAPFLVAGGEVLLDGFEIEGALRQTGTVGIAPLRGYRVLRHVTDDSDLVQRTSTTAVRTRVPFVTTAYQFLQQPYRLLLEIQRQRPSTTVRPRWVVSLSEEHTTLDVDLLVRVDSGLVEELPLVWPAGRGTNWTLISADAGVQLVDVVGKSEVGGSGPQRIKLATPQENDFRVRLQFRRDDITGMFDVGLPRVTSDRTLSGWLIVRGTDAIEPTVDAVTAPDMVPLVENAADSWLKEWNFQPEFEQAYRLSEQVSVVSGRVTTHPREVQAQTVVRVGRGDPNRLTVRQEISFHVRYGRLSSVPLRLPPEFPKVRRGAEGAALQCSLADGTPLMVHSDEGGPSVDLPERLTGTFSLQLQYSLPRNGPGLVQLPIIQTAVSDFQNTTVEFERDDTIQIEPQGKDWELVPTASNRVWFSDRPQSTFPAVLRDDVRAAPQSYQVETALARVECDEAGLLHFLVDYRIDNPPRTIVLGLPSSQVPPRFWWNGEPLANADSKPNGAITGYELQFPASRREGSHWLRVEYTRPEPLRMSAMAHAVATLPVLPNDVSVYRYYVEITLPRSHNLLTNPEGMSPLFRWEASPIWQREPSAEYLAVRNELLPPWEVDSAEFQAEQQTTPEFYAFRSIGRVEQLSFRTISLWMLILIGSGTTLGFAFLLWSVPATRNILTMLVACFVLSFAGVFAAEAVELLLQPALLGLVAAAVAMVMHNRTQPPQRMPRNDSGIRSSGGLSGSRREEGAAGTPIEAASTQLRPISVHESGIVP